ncbi:MAG: rRNA maturation RNase YbeY [Acidimicrobiia bacterium]|nr:rRNA maturation RNase YbeY [Acidimicrobiia bacterium]
MSVFLADEQSESLDLASLRRLAELVLDEEGFPPDTQLTVLLVDDEEIAIYNSRFLDRRGPTDVLAFPVEHLLPGIVPEHDPLGPPLIIGDVIISPAYVRRQAAQHGVGFESEMSLMVTHGILHLLGYTHDNDGDAERMEQRERELLSRVGVTRR